MQSFPEPARLLVDRMSAAAAADPGRAVAFQGAPGANSHRAAMEVMPDGLPLPCFSFEDALDAVKDGRAGQAIIPIENSQHGRVADIHFLLPESGLSIVGEHFLDIHHCLMARPDAGQIGAAYSHPQALGQSRFYLRERGIVPMAYADTAGAAALVAESGEAGIAAIAPRIAAELYGLDLLAEDIEDAHDNTTRFVLLAKTPRDPATLNGDSRAGQALTTFGADDHQLRLPGAQHARRALQGAGRLCHQWRQHDQAGKLPEGRQLCRHDVLCRYRRRAGRSRSGPRAG